MISLMGFFEEGVGPDTISDFTSTAIKDQLGKITEEFCSKHKIPMDTFNGFAGRTLPFYTALNGKKHPMLLVPRDIVRDLPIANDWSGVERASEHNMQIRQQVNSFLGHLAKPTVADRKAALRKFAFTTSDFFELFLATIKEHTTAYDPNSDVLGYFKFKELIAAGHLQVTPSAQYDLGKGPDEIRKIVLDAIDFYRRQIEDGNLWEELWIGNKPKKERASQLFFAAIAEAYCKAHNVDISPEANMGGGPIDFKFSNGYNARVLVEMKRSSGTVEHGYETQLEIYKKASKTEFAIFVVMDFGDLGSKLKKIRKLRNERLTQGQRASDIIVIDASKKTSASKRGKKSPPTDLVEQIGRAHV